MVSKIHQFASLERFLQPFKLINQTYQPVKLDLVQSENLIHLQSAQVTQSINHQEFFKGQQKSSICKTQRSTKLSAILETLDEHQKFLQALKNYPDLSTSLS